MRVARWWEVLLAAVVVVVTAATPIPGDEAVAGAAAYSIVVSGIPVFEPHVDG
jgi:hypothetical protein